MTRTTRQPRGAATVEFALVLGPFLLLLLGAIEMGRVLFTYNAAVEATRRGARTAVVSVQNSAAIRTDMRTILPDLTDANVVVSYLPAGCLVNCAYVAVSLQNYSVTPLVWPLGTIALPAFTTTLPVESLGHN